MEKPSSGKIVYTYQNAVYINLTNRCPAQCVFCIKNRWKYQFRGNNLRLQREPSAAEVITELERLLSTPGMDVPSEFVFCGYGEPFLRYLPLRQIARWLKSRNFQVRINTIGYANLILKRNIVPEMVGLVDAISISLNAETETIYTKICRPKLGIGTYPAVLTFIRECRKYIPRVQVTVMDMPGINIDKCKQLAGSLGVKLLVRRYLSQYENE